MPAQASTTRIQNVSHPRSLTTIYTVDGGRLTQITDEAGTTALTYDDFGRVQAKIQTQGTVARADLYLRRLGHDHG